MNLDELNLNRYLTKDSADDAPDSSLVSSPSENTTDYGGGSTDPSTNPPASAVSPGTIITSTIVQSSPSQDRVQIGPDDAFVAYNNGVEILRIDKNGINGSGGTITFSILNVTGKFNYAGEPQPVLYSAEVDQATGALSNGPAGWTGVKTGPGTYQITHNLGLAAPYLRLFGTQQTTSGVDSPFISQTANDFTFFWTIQPGSVAVDVSFNFLALQYLP